MDIFQMMLIGVVAFGLVAVASIYFLDKKILKK